MLFLAVVKEQSFCSYCLEQNLVYQSLSWELSIETKIQPLEKLCLHLKQLDMKDIEYRLISMVSFDITAKFKRQNFLSPFTVYL